MFGILGKQLYLCAMAELGNGWIPYIEENGNTYNGISAWDMDDAFSEVLWEDNGMPPEDDDIWEEL